MNKSDRKELGKVIDWLNDAQSAVEADEANWEQAIQHAQDAMDTVEQLADAEQEKFDNMSEGLQASPTGEAIQEAADALAEARDAIQEAMDILEDTDERTVEDAVEKLGEAVNAAGAV